ncbi:PIR protein [Plasmodium vivax]|nr:PIR protein [Plasmodium vivax]
MAGKSSNPWYFTYHEYDAVKKSFVYEPDDKIDMSFVSRIMEPIRGNTIIKERMLYDTFYEFKKLIIRHYSFLQHGKDKCCNYINYWLNKKVRESDYRVDKQNFEIFDKFMRVDAKIKGSSIDCVSKLSYMDTDTFEKMKKLYDLYDYFSDLKKSENPSSLCKNISFLAEKYESAFKKCNENDNYFCKMLTSLKDVIARDQLVAKNICTTNIFDVFYKKIDPTPPPKKPTAPITVQRRNHGRAHPRPTVSVSSSPPHVRKSAETHATHSASVSSSRAQGLEKQAQGLGKLAQVLQYKAKKLEGEAPALENQAKVLEGKAQLLEEQVREDSNRTLSEPSEQFPQPLPRPLPLLTLGQLESSDDTSEPTGPKEPYEMPELASELGQGPLQEHGPRFSPERPEWLEGPVQPQEHDVGPFREVEEDTFLQEGYQPADSMQSTFDTGTIMGAIKDAVSNVLEAVEPVPILGVSGGMGALYLLLKCTPIGSIFRRNKRNNQYIPNFFGPRYGEQFSGYYPEYYNEDFQNYRMNIAYHPSSDALD